VPVAETGDSSAGSSYTGPTSNDGVSEYGFEGPQDERATHNQFDGPNPAESSPADLGQPESDLANHPTFDSPDILGIGDDQQEEPTGDQASHQDLDTPEYLAAGFRNPDDVQSSEQAPDYRYEPPSSDTVRFSDYDAIPSEESVGEVPPYDGPREEQVPPVNFAPPELDQVAYEAFDSPSLEDFGDWQPEPTFPDWSPGPEEHAETFWFD
jgi:hypothetical protein